MIGRALLVTLLLPACASAQWRLEIVDCAGAPTSRPALVEALEIELGAPLDPHGARRLRVALECGDQRLDDRAVVSAEEGEIRIERRVRLGETPEHLWDRLLALVARELAVTAQRVAAAPVAREPGDVERDRGTGAERGADATTIGVATDERSGTTNAARATSGDTAGASARTTPIGTSVSTGAAPNTTAPETASTSEAAILADPTPAAATTNEARVATSTEPALATPSGASGSWPLVELEILGGARAFVIGAPAVLGGGQLGARWDWLAFQLSFEGGAQTTRYATVDTLVATAAVGAVPLVATGGALHASLGLFLEGGLVMTSAGSRVSGFTGTSELSPLLGGFLRLAGGYRVDPRVAIRAAIDVGYHYGVEVIALGDTLLSVNGLSLGLRVGIALAP